MNDDFVSVDFETSYTKTRDIKSLGIVPYLRDPETDIYRVSHASGDGKICQIGHPTEVDWAAIHGREWISHNASFDSAAFAEMQKRWPESLLIKPRLWNCTADLCAFIQAPRALGNAAKVLLDFAHDKSVRAEMRGKDFIALGVVEKVRLDDYALKDAILCAMIWRHFSGSWPERERELSRHTTMMGQRGIGFDPVAAEKGMTLLMDIIKDAEEEIPWKGPIGSSILLNQECRKLGITPPESTDAKSDIFDRWAEEHGMIPFVATVQRWRRANRLLRVVEGMEKRCIDGRIRYNLKYFGAHTGRWSGDAGLNLQNLPREPFHGVDVRQFLVPAPGNVFLVGDLAQIEARVTLWLAQDGTMLRKIADGVELYEAYARERLGYVDPRPMKEVDPKGRQLAKAIVLALGFGMGPIRFVQTAKALVGLKLDQEAAKKLVYAFRDANPGIVGLWGEFDRLLQGSVGDVAVVTLPSGRSLRYFDVRSFPGRMGDEVSVQFERGGNHRRVWGGVLTENAVQAIARDILAEAILKAEGHGLPVVLHVHDEVVCEVPRKGAGEAAGLLKLILETPPAWVSGSGLEHGLPLEAEVKKVDRYGK